MNTINFLLDSTLYSYSQIFFSNKKWFGLIALIATCIVPEPGIMGLFGVLLSNLIAVYLKFDKEKIRTGFYGFNGLLFGAASVFYFQPSLFLFILIPVFIVVTFFLTAVLENYMAEAFNLPGLSLPFIFTLYVFIIFMGYYPEIKNIPFVFNDTQSLSFLPKNIKNYFYALSLIILQNNILSGIIISLALLLFSRVMFVVTIVAFVFSTIFINLLNLPQTDLVYVLSGFNSILTGLALGGSLIILSRKTIFLTAIANLLVVIFIVFFSSVLLKTGLPVLVLPFNFVVLSVIYSLKFRQEHSDLVLLYFNNGSPEENFYYHTARKIRFEKFKYYFAELPVLGEWFVSQGRTGEYTHKDKWKDAVDFVIRDSENKEYGSNANSLQDYYCYNLPVVSPLDGVVENIINGIEDNAVGEVNLNNNWGNTIIIRHDVNFYSALSHLKKDSFRFNVGDYVRKGDILATCGNSGRSPFPHVHFQFQSTPKLGDFTIYYPFAFYTQKENSESLLKSFSFPDSNTFVQNIEVNKSIIKAFNFNLNDELKVSFEHKGKDLNETWVVKVDYENNLYIENNKLDKAFIYSTNKVFYFNNYIGSKNSALFYFYLSSSQVPLGSNNNIIWKDEIPFTHFNKLFIKYLSEFFLLLDKQISVNTTFNFSNGTGNQIVLNSSIMIKGKWLFSFYKKNIANKVTISEDGKINTLEFNYNSKKGLNFLFSYPEE